MSFFSLMNKQTKQTKCQEGKYAYTFKHQNTTAHLNSSLSHRTETSLIAELPHKTVTGTKQNSPQPSLLVFPLLQ